MEKIVSQLNDSGYFVGAVVADESPLEPGVFLIPGGAIDMDPPAVIEPGKRYKPAGDQWDAEDIPEPEPQAEAEPQPPTDEQLAASALAQRDALLSIAAIRIAPLQDAVDLGMATSEEESALIAWKQYRVALNRIEQQASFPQAIDWPQPPA